jgi:hypothetical protein
LCNAAGGLIVVAAPSERVVVKLLSELGVSRRVVTLRSGMREYPRYGNPTIRLTMNSGAARLTELEASRI